MDGRKEKCRKEIKQSPKKTLQEKNNMLIEGSKLALSNSLEVLDYNSIISPPTYLEVINLC